MVSTRDDEARSPEPRATAQADAKLARKAEALRANLKRRKAQTRGRAAPQDEDPARAD